MDANCDCKIEGLDIASVFRLLANLHRRNPNKAAKGSGSGLIGLITFLSITFRRHEVESRSVSFFNGIPLLPQEPA
jgi:hypothetical protein